VLILFAVGALVMLGAAAYGLAHGQNGQRNQLESRFRSRAQLGAALVGSLFSASAPGQQQQASQRNGAKLSEAELDRQAAAGNSKFIAITDAGGHVLAASSGADQAKLEDEINGGAMFLRRALASNSYGLSGIQPDGSIYTALPFKSKDGTRVQITGVDPKLLAAFLGGTLHQEIGRAHV